MRTSWGELSFMDGLSPTGIFWPLAKAQDCDPMTRTTPTAITRQKTTRMLNFTI
jgi:hypothetical protein